jgi:hypothetical protein
VKHIGLICLAACIVFGAATPARAQSRPLTTEDPETVPAGHVLVEGGLDFAHGAEFPFAGLTGNLWRLAVAGASIGVGPFAEIQMDWGLSQRLKIAEHDPEAPFAALLAIAPSPPPPMPVPLPGLDTWDALDLRVGAKLRFASETDSRPAIAGRFWTRVPFANPESGLGTGTSDVHAGLAIGKTVRSVRTVVNVALGSAGDPLEGHRRHLVVDYGASLARAVRTGMEIVGELAGRTSPDEPGAPPASTMVRVGGRLTHGPARVDAGIALGLNDADPTWSVTAGATWVLRAFDAP